jgi:hypothetical protein
VRQLLEFIIPGHNLAEEAVGGGGGEGVVEDK